MRSPVTSTVEAPIRACVCDILACSARHVQGRDRPDVVQHLIDLSVLAIASFNRVPSDKMFSPVTLRANRSTSLECEADRTRTVRGAIEEVATIFNRPSRS